MGSRCHSVEHVEDLRARSASLDHSGCGCVCVCARLSLWRSLYWWGGTHHMKDCLGVSPYGLEVNGGWMKGRKRKMRGRGNSDVLRPQDGLQDGGGGDICFGQPSQPISAHRYVVCEGSSSTLSLFLSSHQNLSIALSHTSTFSPC